MGLVGGRLFIFLAVLLVLVGWGAGNGYIRFERSPYKCYGGAGLYAEVGKQPLIVLGRLHVYYQPLSWGCDKDRRYDPSTYHVENGILVPIHAGPIQ
jgi:hypothetical protein